MNHMNQTATLQTIGTFKRAVLLVAIGACALLAGATAPALAADTTITVNTEADLLETDPNELVQACLGEAQSEPAKSPLQLVETTLAEPQTDQPGVVVKATRCSLRMALETARQSLPVSLITTNQTSDVGGATIDFALPLGATINLNLNGLIPLPPITAGRLVIDGCRLEVKPAGFPTTYKGPCVNVRLPDSLGITVEGLAVGGLPSLAPSTETVTNGFFVAADQVTIRGLAIQGVGPAIYTPAPGVTQQIIDRLKVQNNYFGLTVGPTGSVGEDSEDPAPQVAIWAAGNNTQIGGRVITDSSSAEFDKPSNFVGNVFAGNSEYEAIGVLVAGGLNTTIQGNRFGVRPDGSKTSSSLGTGVKLVGVGLDDTNLFDTSGTQIGGSLAIKTMQESRVDSSGKTVTVTVNDPEASSALTPECDGPCNLFGNMSGDDFELGAAIEIGGPPLVDPEFLLDAAFNRGELPRVSNTRIQGNQIGVVTTRTGSGTTSSTTSTPAGNELGVLVRNGAYGTTIGDGDARLNGNVISNSDGPGVAVHTDAGPNTKIIGNTGFNNDANLLIDLGDFSNPGFGVGSKPYNLKEPWIVEANGVETTTETKNSSGEVVSTTKEFTGATVKGTAAPGSAVHLYAVPVGQDHAKRTHGDVESYVGQATADGSGNWTATNLKIPAGTTTEKRRVTATATVSGKGTSELALNTEVGITATQTVVVTLPVVISTVQPPSTPFADLSGPRIARLLGARPPRKGALVLNNVPKVFNGTLSDPNGVARVDVTVEVEGARRTRTVQESATRRVPTCAFIYLKAKRSKLLRTACAEPPYSQAKGTTRWSHKLDRKAQRRIKRGKVYVLYVRAQDRLGNLRTSKVKFKVRSKRRR